jgi:putative endonuclease
MATRGVPKDGRSLLGSRGEGAARRHLESIGYRIVAERYRSRLGEIDLVAEDGTTLVFVEVKTRRSAACGSPEESVTPAKQRRIARLAAAFLAARGLYDRDCRFDVVAVEEGSDGRLDIRHHEDAFRS